MRIDWQRHIPEPLAWCIAFAIYLFIIAGGIWFVSR